MRRVVLYARSPEWGAMIELADVMIGLPGFHAVKSEGKTVAGFLDLRDGAQVFLKRVTIPSWSRESMRESAVLAPHDRSLAPRCSPREALRIRSR